MHCVSTFEVHTAEHFNLSRNSRYEYFKFSSTTNSCPTPSPPMPIQCPRELGSPLHQCKQSPVGSSSPYSRLPARNHPESHEHSITCAMLHLQFSNESTSICWTLSSFAALLSVPRITVMMGERDTFGLCIVRRLRCAHSPSFAPLPALLSAASCLAVSLCKFDQLHS